MGSIGYSELLLILLIVLLLFGGRKIPEVMRGLGRGLREFRKARDDFREAIEGSGDEYAATNTTPPVSPEQAGASESAVPPGDAPAS